MLGGPGKVADRSVTSLAAINAGLPDSPDERFRASNGTTIGTSTSGSAASCSA